MMWLHGPWWDGFGWMWIVPLAFLVVMVVIAIRLGASMRDGSGPREPGAREILDRRYARGEITREQYQQMRRDLD